MKRSASGNDGRPSPNRRNRRRGTSANMEQEREPGDSTAEELSSSRSSQSASRPSESAGEEMAPTVTYPNPRSFAERLMFVLESRAAPDTIWWEGDGTIVALHIDNIKTGTILRDHFQGIRYKFFIRYFSRWGFKRINNSSVPNGIFYYQNALFERERPHLVKHMRMDSQVQNIFAEHESSDNLQSDASQNHSSMGSQSGQLGQHQPAGQQLSDTALMQQLIDLAGRNYSQQDQSNPVLFASGQWNSASSETSQDVSAIINALTGQQHVSSAGGNISRTFLLQQILRLSNEYLNQTADEIHSFSDISIRAILQILQIVGQQAIQQEQMQSLPNQNASLQQLLDLLNPNANSNSRET